MFIKRFWIPSYVGIRRNDTVDNIKQSTSGVKIIKQRLKAINKQITFNKRKLKWDNTIFNKQHKNKL